MKSLVVVICTCNGNPKYTRLLLNARFHRFRKMDSLTRNRIQDPTHSVQVLCQLKCLNCEATKIPLRYSLPAHDQLKKHLHPLLRHLHGYCLKQVKTSERNSCFLLLTLVVLVISCTSSQIKKGIKMNNNTNVILGH